MEFKFQGKREDNGKWVQGDLLYLNGSWISRKEKASLSLENVFKVQPETVCQYANKKDKYGEEIYSGDVIKIYDKQATWVGEVYFNENKLAWMIRTKDYDICSLAYCKNFKRINSIHDNPELIT